MDCIISRAIFVTVLLPTLVSFVSAQTACPYENPAAHAMTCIEGMPQVGYTHVPAATETPSRKRRETVTEEAVVTKGTPDLSPEFMKYFCSDAGEKMIECTSDVMEKCSDSMPDALFNSDQARKARAMCDKVSADFDKSHACINASMQSKSTTDCFYEAFRTAMGDKSTGPREDKLCRATARGYNCIVEHATEECGKDIIIFSIAVMRTMEPRRCSPIIDAIYNEPVSSSTHVIPSILALTISMLYIFA